MLEKMCWCFVSAILYISTVTVSTSSLKDLPNACFNYKELTHESRLWESATQSGTESDYNLQKGWYRVVGNAGNALKQGRPVDPSTVPLNHCGTKYSGTLLGQHPDESEGVVPMTVCFRDKFCYQKADIECPCQKEKVVYVQNCRNHYIYWLSPTGQEDRYCTGQVSMKPPTVDDKGISTAIECKEHDSTTLSDRGRQWGIVGTVSCDNLYHGWFRFTGAAGTEMASECVLNEKSVSRLSQPCGAEFRGWLVDKHPTISEGRAQRRVCFSYGDSCGCEFYANVAIRNCGEFFVYRLSGIPICKARYCGAPVNATSAITDITKPEPPGPRVDMCKMYKVLHDPDRLWSYTGPTMQKCDAHLYGKFRFGSLYTPWSIREGCDPQDLLVKTHRCGAKYPGYLVGKHPAVIDGVVERIVCFTEANNPCVCRNTTVVKIQNCDGYYVYDFRSVPSCNSRFCMVANGTTDITIDIAKPPTYEIPPPHIKPQPQAAPKESEDAKGLIATTTVLAIIVLVVIILLIVVIILFIFVMKKHRKARSIPVDVEDNHNQALLDDSQPEEETPMKDPPNGRLPEDSENLPHYELEPLNEQPPPPENPPPSAPPSELITPEEDEDDDVSMHKGPGSDDELNELEDLNDEVPSTSIDSEEKLPEDYDTLKERDILTPVSYEESTADSM